MRERWCKVCRGWHELEAWPHNCMPERNMAQSDLPMPQVSRTALDDLWNPVDGKRYTNSRNFAAAVKAKGCEIIGNDSALVNAKPKKVETPKGRINDLLKSWEQAST
jgi:hypothetical protein